MKPYEDLINKIPREAWQYLEAEYNEDEEGNGTLEFFWDPDEHPELSPLNELDDDQWNDFVTTSLQRTLDLDENEGSTEPSDRNDGPGGELDQQSDS